MKILLLGANGLYGTKLAQLCLEQNLPIYLSGTKNLSNHSNYLKIDITNKSQVDVGFSKIQPEIVIHAAGLTNVDICETNKTLAWKVNVEGTRNITTASKRYKSFLVYLSTDYIFNGEKGNYTETDIPDPINYYGKTKLEAENIIKSTLNDFCIIRPSVIFGSKSKVRKKNFALCVINNLKKAKQIEVTSDQWNSPTLNTNLSEMTLEVVKRKITGTFHFCGATRVNRLEFAHAIASIFNLNSNLIHPIKSEDFVRPAKRPKDSSLDTTKAQQQLECKPLKLNVALTMLRDEIEKKKNTAPVKSVCY